MSVGERSAIENGLDSSSDDELTRVLADYLAEVEAGRGVDPEQWIEKHPAIAERLRTCLKGLHMVEEFAGTLGAGSPRGDAEFEGPTLGDFRIVRPLGRGGMGVVYEALEVSLGRRVALKVLPFGAAIDPRRLARFRVESHAAAQLHHPHIIPVYSVGSEAGVHYYAMQLIEGTTLAERIAECRRLEQGTASPADRGRPAESSSILSATSTDSGAFFREAARLGLEAALALEHAHENGVLHRDVKPSNLMVDGTGHLWVADFGLARFQSDSSLTVSGDMLGTLRYMSPEQALGNRGVVDQRTDVYSLGATLYELITLHPAFEGSNRQDLLRQIAQDEPRRPRALRREVPLDLETIVLKAVAKDAASRYATAGELALDLKRFLDDQPILARRPRLAERLTRLARKHMAVVMAVVPLLLVMVGGLSVGIVLVLGEQSQILKQRGEISDKKTEAEKSRAEARRQRDAARRAVDDMYTLVAQNWLRQQTNLLPVQRDFLQKALAYYQEFAGATDADPETRIAAAWAFYRVGDIERRFGKPGEGERGYRQAIEIVEAVGAGKPMNADLLEPLAESYAGLGEVLDETGRGEESTKMHEHAIVLWRLLIESTPDTAANASILATRHEQLGTSLGRSGRYKEAEAEYQKALELGQSSGQPATLTQARSSMNFAVVLQKQGKLAEAQRQYRVGVEQFESLVKREPGEPTYRVYLAEALLNLGQALARDSAEIEPVFRRALTVYQGLASASPEVAAHRSNLATTLLNLTNLFSGAGRLREAETTAREAVVLLETLVNESPKVVRNQEMLVRSVTWLARIRAQTGQTATALADAQRGRELYEKLNPKDIDLLADRASNLTSVAYLEGQSGRIAEADKFWRLAAGEFEVLASRFPARLEFRSELASQLTQVALSRARNGHKAAAERDFRRAIEILERVLADAPERSAVRLRLAQSAHHFGHFLFGQDSFAESERFYRIAFQAYERLFLENYQQDVMIRGCADCTTSIAMLQLQAGRIADAINSYVEGLKLVDSLPPETALDRGLRASRGGVLDNLGQALVRSGDRKNAEQRTRQGLKIRETLVADFPGEAGYLDSLALSKRHLGDILASRGATAEARGLLEQGVELGQKAVKADPRVREAQLHLRGSRKSLARYLVDQGAYADAAVMIDGVVGDELPENRYGTLVEAALNLEECAHQALVDAKQSRERREAAALTYAKRSIELLKKAAENDASSKESSVATMYLAWLRMASSVAEMRDPREALRLGRELTGRLPKRGDSWTILGAASYHCGDYQAALSAFQKAHEVDSAKFGFWDYYVAMVHFELGDVLEALASFARAEGWMKANPHAKRHERVAAHAARVLKLSEPGPASGQGRGVPAAAKGT